MVERPHRTLADMVQCALHSANLGPEYWSYALIHVVYIKNRLLHMSISQTPYEVFTGHKPDLNGIKIFGSRVVAQNTQHTAGQIKRWTVVPPSTFFTGY